MFRPFRAQTEKVVVSALMVILPITEVAADAGGVSELQTRWKRLEAVKPATLCAHLSSLDLQTVGGEGSRITKAEDTTVNGRKVCRVTGVLAPSIGFEVRLPNETWTQRYLQVGCGGLCGGIRIEAGAADGCVPLDAGGFVVASTDMGHEGRDASFGDDPQKRADFAYRAQHLTAVAAKKLILAYYGRPQAYAYFTGCSDGGREALVEAQRFPDDFNGIIAGAAAMNFQAQNALFHAWQARANTGPNGKAILVAARLPVLHKAVLSACDKLDGLEDGLISDPLGCHFDPGSILCRMSAQDTASCLTEDEVVVARKLYDGPRDPQTNERLTVAGPLPGSELAWAGVYVPASTDQPIFSRIIALDALRSVTFEKNPPPNFDLDDLAIDQATFDRLRPLHPLYDATNPDLSAFEAAGGKLILWHGLADPHISPVNTIAYHVAVADLMGRQRLEAFERLFLFPGMYHCVGGDGPSAFDLLTPMLDWVEAGIAPEAVIARQPERSAVSDFGAPDMRGAGPSGSRDASPSEERRSAHLVQASPSAATVRSRPVYPYPGIAAYDGHGNPNTADSFHRSVSKLTFTMPMWRGANFFQPYAPLER